MRELAALGLLVIRGAKAFLASRLPQSSFVRGASILVGGTAVAQVLPLLATPLLTRLYNPSDFGVLEVFVGLLGVVVVVASLRYELAIPLPEEEDSARDVIALSLLLAAATSGVTAIIVWVVGDDVAELLSLPTLTDFLWLLPVAVLLGSYTNVFRYWAVRQEAFGIIARTRVWQSVVLVATQIVFVPWGSLGLVVGNTASQGAGSVALSRFTFWGKSTWVWNWSGVRKVANRYRNFAQYSTWEGLFNAAGSMAPPVMFAGLFGAAVAGQYGLSARILSIPMALVGVAIGQVFLARASIASRSGALGDLVSRITGQLSRVGLAPTLLLVLTGPNLFVLVFGSDWYQAGQWSRWMAPWLFLVFVISPVSTVFAVMDRQLQGMVFQAGLLSVRVGSILLGARYFGLDGTIALFATVSALAWLVLMVWISVLTDNHGLALIRPTINELPIAVAIIVPTVVGLLMNDSRAIAPWLVGLAISVVALALRYRALAKEW